MTSPVADAAVYSDLTGLAALKRDARAADPKALQEVARQFESIFTKMMLTSMRQASFGDPVFGSDQTQFYQGMFDDQLSLELTKGRGLGLADLLVRQLQGATGAGNGATDTSKNGEFKIAGRGSDSSPTPLSMPSAAAGMAPLDAAGKRLTFDVAGKTSLAQQPEGATLSSEPFGLDMDAALRVASGLARTLRSADAASPSTVTPFISEPVDVDATAALHAATQFIHKMLAGNALANGEPPKFTTPSSPEDFVQQLWPCAEEAGRELGIDPKNLLAQAALETGWGKSLPCDTNGNPSYNFFGIKATADWQGSSVSVRTLEFEGGIPVPRQARFRAYDSAVDSFRDYVAVLRDNPRYAAALNTGNDAKAFATALQRGGYATDPAYAQKISAIAQNLSDTVTALKSAGAQPIP